MDDTVERLQQLIKSSENRLEKLKNMKVSAKVILSEQNNLQLLKEHLNQALEDKRK